MNQAQQWLNQLTGQQATPAAGQPPAAPAQGGGLNLASLLNGPGGLATGAVAGGLVGLLMGGKKPKKIAKTALQAGGFALAGGLAYKAWQNWKANQPVQAGGGLQLEQPPRGTAFNPDSSAGQEQLSRALVCAMIAAAKADGHVTPEERRKMSGQLQNMQLGAAETAFIEEELARPLDIDAIANLAAGPEQAAEVYAASLLAIDPEGPAERAYLSLLAARLKLDPSLVAHLHAGAGAPMVPDAA